MYATHVSPWVPLLATALIAAGLYVAIGYGIIGFALLFLLVALGGGALMSWIGDD